MAAPDIFVVVADVLSWIEDDPTMTKDDAMAKPVEVLPDHVYCYPDTEAQRGYESGPAVKQDFRIVVDVAINDQGEQADGVRDPDVTAALRAKVALYADRVRLHNGHVGGATMTADQLSVSGIEWLVLTGLEFRGARIRLDGYKLWP